MCVPGVRNRDQTAPGAEHASSLLVSSHHACNTDGVLASRYQNVRERERERVCMCVCVRACVREGLGGRGRESK